MPQIGYLISLNSPVPNMPPPPQLFWDHVIYCVFGIGALDQSNRNRHGKRFYVEI